MAAAPPAGGSSATVASARVVTKEELAQHKTKKDCWIVYDVSRFHDKHPGEGINDQYIAMYAGTDVTELFEKYHSTDEPFEWLEKAEHGEFPELTYIGKLAK